MEHLCIVVGDKAQAIHPLGKAENALGHTAQLEVRPQQLVVDFKHRVFLLVAIITVVPRHDFHRLAFQLSGKPGETLHLAALNGQISITQLIEHLINIGRGLGHRVLQLVVGKCLAAHQLSDFQTRVGDVTQHIKITELAAGALAVVHLV